MDHDHMPLLPYNVNESRHWGLSQINPLHTPTLSNYYKLKELADEPTPFFRSYAV
jgi:hypothetical protein